MFSILFYYQFDTKMQELKLFEMMIHEFQSTIFDTDLSSASLLFRVGGVRTSL